MTLQARLFQSDFDREGISTAIGDGLANPGVVDFRTDEDYFAFAAAPKTAYRFTVDGDADFELGLYDVPSRRLLEADDDSGPGVNPEIRFETGPSPQLLLLQVDIVGNGEPGGELEPGGGSFDLIIEDEGFTGPLPPVDEDVVGDAPPDIGGIGEADPLEEGIEFAGDLDEYAIFVEAEHEYRATVRGAEVAGLGILDPFLELIDRRGDLIEADDDSGPGRAAEITFVAEETGFLSLQVSDSDFQRGIGGYEIEYREIGGPLLSGPDRVGDFIDTSILVEAGVPIVESIERGSDFDVFGVSLTRGNTYVIDALALGRLDPTLALLDFDGFELDFNNDISGSNTDSLIRYTPEFTDFYYVEVGGVGRSTGDYDLMIDPVITPEATTLEARSIALLYEAGLGRPAAFVGLNFWIDKFETGDSLTRIAQSFLDSDEFFDTVGDPDFLTDGQFIDGLFLNVIGRPPAQGGFDFWTGQLADGASRAEILLAFARAPENAAQSPEVDTLAQIGQRDRVDPALTLKPNPYEEWDFFAA